MQFYCQRFTFTNTSIYTSIAASITSPIMSLPAPSQLPSMFDDPASPMPTPVYRSPGISHVEDLEGYAPGGYCPVDIGDQFGGNLERYTVLHKLGFGVSSTVWLVRRDSIDSFKPTFHALKILRADLSEGQHPELNLIERLEQAGWKCKAHPNLVQIQRWFIINSANGSHRCFVLPLLGPSLFDPRVLDALDGDQRRSMCEQLTHAVNYLHTFEVCHSRTSSSLSFSLCTHLTLSLDLSPSHVLTKLPPDTQTTQSSLLATLGPIVREKVFLANPNIPNADRHYPGSITQPAAFPTLPFSSIAGISVIGLGDAFPECFPRPTSKSNYPSISPYSDLKPFFSQPSSTTHSTSE